MRLEFNRKVVVITGATGGIGRALAARFSRARARLVLLDLDSNLLSGLADLLEKQGCDVLWFECDITDRQRVNEVFKTVEHQFGGIDVLINNAGISHRSNFFDTEPAVFRKVMEVNFFGALNCTQAALDSLVQRHGLVITLSSMAGVTPQQNRSGYAASKHALHGLFESLRAELGDRLNVMMVCPGFTATDINKNALQGDGSVASSHFSFLGKVSSPVDVADAIYQGAQRGKSLLVLSNVGKLSRLISTFFPGYFERKMSKLERQRSPS